MNTTAATTKQSVSFRWDPTLVSNLKELAKEQNRSFSNFTETLLARAINHLNKGQEIPNDVTKAAIEEARSGKELETLDLSNFDEYVKNL